MQQINYNGKLFDDNAPIFTAANRGYRYGDGFFETMRVVNNKFPLKHLHVQRIERSIATLKYLFPKTTIENIFQQAIELCHINNYKKSARVRLSFFNGNGGVFDDNTPMEYLIETSPLSEKLNHLNEEGLTIGICNDVKKTCDAYANLKSANYLFSRVGVEFAKINHWEDALITNHQGNICESTIANIFWVADDNIFTPPLSEGCVQGVMREYLLSKISVTEKKCSRENLLHADEIFLTNATSGIRWIQHLEGKQYSNNTAEKIYTDFITPLWAS